MNPSKEPRAGTASDVLARLAAFYLTSIPVREGLLIREPNAFFRVDGFRESWPDALGSRDELLDWVKRQSKARLAAVWANAALLGSRRADAVWLDVTDRGHPLIEVHEIKVSRADLVSELRQPEKSAAWMQRADRFWLTVDASSIVEGLGIPDAWGVLALPFGSAPVVVREAPTLIPAVPSRRDVLDYVRRHAVTRWQFGGGRPRVVAGRYAVASRLRPGLGFEN